MSESRVYRQVVTMEIFAIVPPGATLPHTDFDAYVRDAIMQNADQGTLEDDGGITYCVPGASSVTDMKELIEPHEGMLP